ncbi:hypothetical protein GHK50_11570 [Sinorhizobium medicae]|uniref:Uncharacterized protein n=1 Tax=Sinorhizobium medicae TaxID=110321 RepID=A0A6G1WMG6_9HYPH|nr:hypothetical protein [Sinorhizobium medicae]MQX51586.1 hypothetical protein [Sinorhizobium medicae]MQX83729.1 hypothetical protein [Sinorhizobium medicae]RVJ48899.1 hypothetical protein CN166_32315 [Sinorhizobium medicae]RVJ66139.1 hypothetical protein CN167_33520 [Sinorhizobium medicae]
MTVMRKRDFSCLAECHYKNVRFNRRAEVGSEINSDRLLCNESMICDQGRCVEAVFFSKFQAGPLWRDHFVACSLALKFGVSRQFLESILDQRVFDTPRARPARPGGCHSQVLLINGKSRSFPFVGGPGVSLARTPIL